MTVNTHFFFFGPINAFWTKSEVTIIPNIRSDIYFEVSNIYVLPDIRSDIYFEIVGPTAFLSVRTDGPTVFGKSAL